MPDQRSTRSTPWNTPASGLGRGPAASRSRRRRDLGDLALEFAGNRNWSLLAHWAEPDAVHLALLDSFDNTTAVATLPCPRNDIRRLAAIIRPRYASSAPFATCTVSRRNTPPIGGRGSIMAAGTGDIHWRGSPTRRRHRPLIRFSARKGTGCTRSPSARPRGHHRARTFPLLRQRRNCGATRGAARLRTQRYRVAMVRLRHRARRAARRPRIGRQHGGDVDRVCARGGSRAWASSRRARAQWLRALMAELERIANHLGDIGASATTHRSRCMHAHCGVLRERVLRACDVAFGHRLMMDRVIPGGVVDRSCSTTGSTRSGRSSTRSHDAFRNSSNSTTTRHRCRIERSAPEC